MRIAKYAAVAGLAVVGLLAPSLVTASASASADGGPAAGDGSTTPAVTIEPSVVTTFDTSAAGGGAPADRRRDR